MNLDLRGTRDFFSRIKCLPECMRNLPKSPLRKFHWELIDTERPLSLLAEAGQFSNQMG
jgi:hypothetical protein